MGYNFRHKAVALLLIITVVLPTVYSPVFTPRAQAIFGIGDLVIDVKAFARELVDGVAMVLAQRMIDEMVKSTIEFANNGFEGNPAYITDPKGYFLGKADGIAGEFIEGSSLGFLCSPFQRSIRLSLAHQYYQPEATQFQCSLSQIGVNIDNFYRDFDQGGWEAWFSMTQNPTSNPYGAYLEARMEMDSRIANQLALADKQYAINQGFKSLTGCSAYNPDEATLNRIRKYREDWSTDPPDIVQKKTRYDLSKPADACIEDGPIRTAGATIKSQLDRVLPSGLEKLISANHVEQLVGALASGLLKRYVFDRNRDGGTFSDSYADHLGSTNSSPISRPQELECFVDTDVATAGETIVTWSAHSNLGVDVEYTWSGEGITGEKGSEVPIKYDTPGTKTARVTAVARDEDGVRSRTAQCANVTVSKFTPLIVSCSPRVTRAFFGQDVTWTATITGGSGEYSLLQWTGGQDVMPGENRDPFVIWPDGFAQDHNDPIVKSGNTTTVTHTYGRFGEHKTTEVITKLFDSATKSNITEVTLTRKYFKDFDPQMNITDTTLSVIDKDTSLGPQLNVQCKPSLLVTQP